jgi:RNA-directed DNA polymerase
MPNAGAGTAASTSSGPCWRLDVPPLTYFCFADTVSLFEGLDKWLRRRLRQVRWKEWKRPQTRYTNRRALGIPRARRPQLGGLAEGLLAHRGS